MFNGNKKLSYFLDNDSNLVFYCKQEKSIGQWKKQEKKGYWHIPVHFILLLIFALCCTPVLWFLPTILWSELCIYTYTCVMPVQILYPWFYMYTYIVQLHKACGKWNECTQYNLNMLFTAVGKYGRLQGVKLFTIIVCI